MSDFAAQMEAQSEHVRRQMLRTFQTATSHLGQEMIRTKDDGGALPKVTGNLMRSQVATLNSPPPGSEEKEFSGSDIGATIAQAGLTDTIHIGMQAGYARRMNYGFVGPDSLGRVYNQAGNHYMERAVNMWPELVERAAREVRGA